MRVVQLGPFPPPHGGVQSNVVAIRDYLRCHGIDCAVVNITKNRKPDADDVYYPDSAISLLNLLAKLRPDVIHLHVGGNYTPRLLALSAACCAWPGARSVLTFHSGGFPKSPQAAAFRKGSWRALLIRQFDALIAVNQEIARFFEQSGASTNRIRIIAPHALMATPATRLNEPLAAFYEFYNPILISVGLLEPEYDLPLQIQVLPRIRKHHPKAGLVMIGSGSQEQTLREAIAATPGILLTGDVPHAEALRAIEQSTVLLRTTLYDGDAVSVREAIHLGTPVIATNNEMRPEGCKLIPPSNLDALEEAIKETLTAIRAERRQSPSNEKNIEAVQTLYKELTEK